MNSLFTLSRVCQQHLSCKWPLPPPGTSFFLLPSTASWFSAHLTLFSASFSSCSSSPKPLILGSPGLQPSDISSSNDTPSLAELTHFHSFKEHLYHTMGFPGGSAGTESACNAEDPSSIPGSGRSPGEGNGNPLQYSCLENPMDGGAWRAIVHGVAKSWTQLSDFTIPYNLAQSLQRMNWSCTRRIGGIFISCY